MKSTLLILKNFVMLIVVRNIQTTTEFLQSILCALAFVFIVNTSSQAQVVNAPKPAAKSSMMYILFELGKSEFNSEYVAKLDSFCNKWKDSSEFRVYLYGNTDSIGRKSFNDSLAAFRVQQVSNYLVAKGIKLDWIKLNILGEEKPKFANDSLHKHLNRRVDLIVRYGLGKPKADPAPVVAAKKVTKQVVQTVAKVEPEPEPITFADTIINIGTDLQIILNKTILEQLASNGTELVPTFNNEYLLSGFKLRNPKGDLSSFPKPVTYRYKVEKPLDNTCVDTLWYYDVDKSNTLKRVVGKVRYEKKKDGTWLKFKTRWMPNGGDENWWARIRLGLSPCMFMANSFNIESPGYRITSIKIKLNDTIMKSVPFTRSIFSEMATINNFIGSNPFLDNEYTWEELSTNELEISLTGLDGKLYVVNKTLMELKHSTKKMQPVLKEPKYHIHKDGCGHCGLTGGRIYFVRLSGNSTALATKKIMPELFTIMPNDMIDLGSVVTK